VIWNPCSAVGTEQIGVVVEGYVLLYRMLGCKSKLNNLLLVFPDVNI
jgi:hypothetical protein